MPPDSLELLTIEREIRELASSAETYEEARAEIARAIERARLVVDEVAQRLETVEADARERRRDRGDVVLRRVDLERELNEALETESLSGARRTQFEQRTAGLRGAQAFAASNRADAELAQDSQRVEREALTERRAEHEARICAEAARQALGDEQRATKMRRALEERVDAVREEEATLNRRRDAAEAIASDVREELERVRSDYERAVVESERLDTEISRYDETRVRTEKRLRSVRGDAKERLEARLAELRATETSLQRQCVEIERLIGIVDSDGPIDEPLDFGLLEDLPRPDPAAVQARPATPVPQAAPARQAAPRPAKREQRAAKTGDSISAGLARMLVGTLFPPRGDRPA